MGRGDVVGRLVANHHAGRVGVGRGDLGHDGCVRDPKIINAFQRQIRRDRRTFAAHPDRAHGMIGRPATRFDIVRNRGVIAGQLQRKNFRRGHVTHWCFRQQGAQPFQTGNKDFVDGKMIFLQGSPEMEEQNGIQFGRLSGIVAHYVPSYLQRNRLPSWETNCIADWEAKVDAIVAETIDQPMTVIGGIPSWVQMYFERLIEKAGKPVGEIFPQLEVYV